MALETGLIPDVFDDRIPDLTVHESEWDEKRYKSTIRGFSRFYNTRGSIFDTNQGNDVRMSEIERIRENFAYLAGRQKNKDYAFMATDGVTRQEDALSIVPGQKVAQLVEWMRGRFQEMITNMEMVAESISEDVKTKETTMFDKLMLQMIIEPHMQEITNMGIKYQPAGSQFSPQIPEDVYRWMDQDFRQAMETVSKSIGQDILYSNDFRQLFLREATHILAAGRCGVECVMVDGKMKWQHIPSWQLIIDRSHDDDYLKKARFKGYIHHMTPSELYTRWTDWTPTEKEIINALSSGQTVNYGEQSISYEMINQGWANLNWFQRKNGNILDIGVVKMYWKTTFDMNYKKRTDKYGNVHTWRPDFKGKNSDYLYEGWRQGVLVANMFLKDAGPVPNRVGALANYIEDDCPLRIYMPNMNMGENVAITDRLKKHQDRIDAYRRKVTNIVSQTIGKGAIVNGAAFGIKESTKIVADLKRDGITVVNMATGEPGEDVMQKFVQQVDLTGDPNVSFYIQLMQEEERNMEEIANVPKIAQGLQQGYVGAGVQDRTLQQSSLGTATTYYGFIEYLNQMMQYSVNVAKFAMTADKDNYLARLRVGDYGYKFMKITRDIRLEEAMVYFHVQDVVDEAAKQRIRAYAQAFSQNVDWGVDPLDILRLERARTWTQMISDLEYSLKRKNREKAQKEAMQQLINQINMEKQRADMAAQEQLRSITSRQNTIDNVQGGVMQEAIAQNPSLVGGPAPDAQQQQQPQQPAPQQPQVEQQ